MYGVAVPDLWGSMGLLWLRPFAYGVDLWALGPYGDLKDLCMGLRCQTYVALWDCCGCILGPMGWTYGAIGPYGDFQDLCMGLLCQTCGALWGIQISIVAAFLDLWGVWNCGARPMGICGESALLLWLRSRTYGVNYGAISLGPIETRTNRNED